MDTLAGCLWVRFLGGLCDRGKLDEQHVHEREPRQGIVTLYDRTNERHRRQSGAFECRRSGGLRALCHSLGTGVAVLCADPVVRNADASFRGDETDGSGRACTGHHRQAWWGCSFWG